VDNHVRLALFVAMVIGHALPGGAQIDPRRFTRATTKWSGGR